MSNTEALRAAAQAVLDRWDSPQWEWTKQGPTADLMHALRAALAAPAVPVAWHCPRDPDSATAFFWRRPMNGLCPNCVNPLVPVVLAAAPTAQQEPTWAEGK